MYGTECVGKLRTMLYIASSLLGIWYYTIYTLNVVVVIAMVKVMKVV